MYAKPKYLGSGEKCLVVEFANDISMQANIKLQGLRRLLEQRTIRGVREYVPTYRSLSIHHDPLVISRDDLITTVEEALGDIVEERNEVKNILVMPVAYGGEFGPDLGTISCHTGFSEEEVIRRHTANDCYCFMLGFTPGFGYLAGLDEALETPRLNTPRTLIPAGSVGIAGKQTGAYSIDSPGGWQLLGRTPLRLFDPEADVPTLIEAGDWIRFAAVTLQEYAEIAKAVEARQFSPKRIVEGGDG